MMVTVAFIHTDFSDLAATERIVSKNRLLTTVAWQLDGSLTYALEGSIFAAGA